MTDGITFKLTQQQQNELAQKSLAQARTIKQLRAEVERLTAANAALTARLAEAMTLIDQLAKQVEADTRFVTEQTRAMESGGIEGWSAWLAANDPADQPGDAGADPTMPLA